MKIEIQASGESEADVVRAIRELAGVILCEHPKDWHVLSGTAQASAVVVKEED